MKSGHHILPAVPDPEQAFGVNYKGSNRGSANARGLTGGGQRHWRQKKNDREGSLAPKFETADANQSNYSFTCTGARVAGRLLRVYKASPVVPKSFGRSFSSGVVKVR